MRLALALGGGAGLGWAHIGVLRALEARGVEIDAVAGTSIGSVAAVCLAGGRLDTLEEVARTLGTMREIVRFLDLDMRRGGVLGGKRVIQHLRAQFGAAHLDALAIPCAVVATDLMTGDEVAMTDGPVVEAVRASIAIPGVFSPVKRGDMLLVDGGLVAPVPVRAVRALSSAPVLAVNLLGDYRRRAVLGLTADKHSQSLVRIGRAGLGLVVANLARLTLTLEPADIVLNPPVGHIDVQNFTRASELIDIGAATVAANWAAIEALAA